MQCLTWAFSKPRGSQQEPFTSPARWSRSCSQRLRAGHPWVPGLRRGEGSGTGGSRAKQGDTQNQKNPGQVLASQACFPGSRMSLGLHREGFRGCHPPCPWGPSPLASASRRELCSPAASAAAPHRRSSPCPAWSAWPSSTASGQSSGSWDIL